MYPQKRIDYWVEQGIGVISDGRVDIWKDIVQFRVRGYYRGDDLRSSIEIIKMLNDNRPLSEVALILKPYNYRNHYCRMVCSIVRAVSDRGAVFYEYVESMVG